MIFHRLPDAERSPWLSIKAIRWLTPVSLLAALLSWSRDAEALVSPNE